MAVPAGEVGPGESAELAAAREAVEEAGITVTNGKMLGERVHPNTGRTMIYVAFDSAHGEATWQSPPVSAAGQSPLWTKLAV